MISAETKFDPLDLLRQPPWSLQLIAQAVSLRITN
jgi:hypothetical protein